MPPKTEVEKIIEKFDKSKRERIVAYLNTMQTEQYELYFLRQPEMQQNKILLEFEAQQSNDVDQRIVPYTVSSEFRFARLQDLDDEQFEEQELEEEFNINYHFSDLQSSILPIDYLLENKDRYFIRQIMQNALFATTQKRFEQFYNAVNKFEEEDVDADKSNILLFYLSDKVAPADIVFKQHPEFKYLKISHMFVRLRQLMGPVRASQYFFVQAVSPRCYFLVNCGIFFAKIDAFNMPVDFAQMYIRDYYEKQQQSEMFKIKQLQVNPYLIGLTYLTEEVESLFDLKGFEEYRSEFLPEKIKQVYFRLFYFKKQPQSLANDEKIIKLEQELQMLRHEQDQKENEKRYSQCKFLTASDEIVCMRWANDLLKPYSSRSDIVVPYESQQKESTFFSLKHGMKCEFMENGEVWCGGAILGLRDSDWHRCDQLNGGCTFCGAEWRGAKIIFKFV